MALSSVDRVRLESMLGLLGSEHPGERANAASLIEQFRKQRGLSWSDMLARQARGFAAPGQPNSESWRVLQTPPPRAPRERVNDRAWRWSMLIGLLLVGLVSLTSAMELHALQQAPPAVPVAQPADPGPTLPAGRGGASDEVSAAFAQGASDRKVWENWRRSDAPRLCAGHLRSDQEELKSACATAAKLLRQFVQRRRTDRGYLSGWNSVAAMLPPERARSGLAPAGTEAAR